MFQPGFKRFHKDLDVFEELTEVRVVLLVTTEATGQPLELSGVIVSTKQYRGMWVLAFPLAGEPSKESVSRVGDAGHFKITVMTDGPYLLALVRDDEMLACKSVYIGSENQEIQISASNGH